MIKPGDKNDAGFTSGMIPHAVKYLVRLIIVSDLT